MKSNWKEKEKRSRLNQTGSEWGQSKRMPQFFLLPPRIGWKKEWALHSVAVLNAARTKKYAPPLKRKGSMGTVFAKMASYKFPPRAAPCEKSEFEYSNSLA